MQAVSVSGGWTYSISFDIIEGNKFGIFGVSQQQNTGNNKNWIRVQELERNQSI